MIIATVMSSLALLAATAALTLTIYERKRSQKQNAALTEQIESLKNGIVPDFEKAKAAVQAVNDFNAGISGILGFEPHEALRKQRAGSFGGEDD